MPISEKEEIQILKSWWKEYGYYILFTILFFFVANFGWRYWQRHQYANLEHSNTVYLQMLNAFEQKKVDEARLFGERLISTYADSIYASFAALMLAKEEVQKGDLKVAVDRLKFVVTQSPNKKLRQLARIRAARILIALKKPQEALDLLAKTDDKVYAAETSEVFGDALFDLGRTREAELSYRKAYSLDENLPLIKVKLRRF